MNLNRSGKRTRVSAAYVRAVERATSARRFLVLSRLGALALLVVACRPSIAGAQDLPATPLQWQFAPPALPVPSFQSARTVEPADSFMKGRFLVGVNISNPLPAGTDLDATWKFSPSIRNTPRKTGWGPSFGLNWFKGEVWMPINGQRVTIGEVKVRPVMAGIGYSFRIGRALASLNMVGGYAITSAKVTGTLPADTTASIDIGRAWVARPNVGVTFALTRRLAIVGSAGYIFAKPLVSVALTHPTAGSNVVVGSLHGDYANVTVGIAFSVF